MHTTRNTLAATRVNSRVPSCARARCINRETRQPRIMYGLHDIATPGGSSNLISQRFERESGRYTVLMLYRMEANKDHRKLNGPPIVRGR